MTNTRFVSSYRSNASYMDGLRRFEVGHVYNECAGRQDYYCKDDTDAEALRSFFAAEAERWPRWASRHGVCPAYPMPAIMVDRARWHEAVYLCAEAVAS